MTTAGVEFSEKLDKTTASGTRRRKTQSKEIIWGYMMIAPLMIGLVIFYLWPTLQSFYFSFTKWGAFGRYQWTGLTNYQTMLKDTELLRSLINTVIFTALSVPGSVVISLLIAALLNQKIRGVGIYRTLYFLPAVTMPAAIALIWRWLYNGDYGLINAAFFRPFNLQGPSWIADPRFALYALIVVAIWSSVGNNMVLFLAGLQSIPKTYYEAASLDGAGPIHRFFRITLPLLSPTIFFSVVIGLINAFQMFDLIYLMFGGGRSTTSPAIESTQTIVYLFFQNAFVLNNAKGYAAAISMLLFAIILVVTIIQFRLQRRWVHYS